MQNARRHNNDEFMFCCRVDSKTDAEFEEFRAKKRAKSKLVSRPQVRDCNNAIRRKLFNFQKLFSIKIPFASTFRSTPNLVPSKLLTLTESTGVSEFEKILNELQDLGN